MSEYQYYEFQAIDRPLTAKEMEKLMTLSSRAEVTSTSFVNEYNYGDFRGDEVEVLAKYFDAFLYVANWGTHRVAFRLPKDLVDVKGWEAYCDGEVVSLSVRGQYVLLDLTVNDEGGGRWEQGEGYLAPLLGVRADLLAGDLRPLYVGWLASLRFSFEDMDDAVEPPVPPGLGKPNAALKALADFLWVEGDLLKVAAQGSAPGGPAGPSREELSAWIAAQPESQKNAWLLALAEEEGASPRQELLRQFREAWSASRPRTEGATGSRTGRQLLDAAESYAEEQKQREQEAKERKRQREAQAVAEARKKHLDALVGREAELWRSAEESVATGKPSEYDWAVELLVDLHELAQREGGNRDDFLSRLDKLREKHRGKRAFLTRLTANGLG
jgi:hypothetical protein